MVCSRAIHYAYLLLYFILLLLFCFVVGFVLKIEHYYMNMNILLCTKKVTENELYYLPVVVA